VLSSVLWRLCYIPAQAIVCLLSSTASNEPFHFSSHLPRSALNIVLTMPPPSLLSCPFLYALCPICARPNCHRKRILIAPKPAAGTNAQHGPQTELPITPETGRSRSGNTLWILMVSFCMNKPLPGDTGTFQGRNETSICYPTDRIREIVGSKVFVVNC
jgi:hypothetical protein